MGKVVPIPLSKAAALRLLRDTASDDSRVNILAQLHAGPWRHVIDYRQIMLCLKEGSLVQHPKVDEQGSTVFVLERYSAGATVQVTAALTGEPGAKKTVIVTEFLVEE
jgi:hypothetical protein